MLQQELENAQEPVRTNNEERQRNAPLPTLDDIKSEYGVSWRNMLSEVDEALADFETLFPELRGRKAEIAGFVWFRGFNDMFGDHVSGEYERNMKLFIQEVRKLFGKPNLPVVIGALGQNGSKPAQENMAVIQKARFAMNDVPEFKGNVIASRTDVLSDKEAERVFPGWRDHFEDWKKVGSDFPYHYLGSAIWFNRIGKAFGEEMIGLLKAQQSCAVVRGLEAGCRCVE